VTSGRGFPLSSITLKPLRRREICCHQKVAAKNPEFYLFSVLIYPEEEESDSDEEMELHPLLTASLRTPITSKKKDIPSLEPPPLPPGWTAVNPGKSASIPTLYIFPVGGNNMFYGLVSQRSRVRFPP
jgi:hypothetical protein